MSHFPEVGGIADDQTCRKEVRAARKIRPTYQRRAAPGRDV
jgi:hypothetical protein